MSASHTFPRSLHLVLVCLVVLTAACAPKVSTKVMLPAAYTEATQARRVAVVPAPGKKNESIARALESRLTQVRVKGEAYFTVIDRQTIDTVIQEQSFSYSGLVDPNTASRLGAVLGAEGIYSATASESVSDSRYTTEQNVCVERNEDGKCVTFEKQRVPCIKRTAQVSVMPRLVDVSTGQVLYSQTIRRSSSASVCNTDTNNSLPSRYSMTDVLYRDALNEFTTHVAPHEVTLRLKLMDDDEGIKSKKNREALESGIDFAKDGRFDRACEIWNRALIEEGKSLSLQYNVGVCLETGSRYEEALARYRAADRLLTKPNKDVSSALFRVQQRMQEQEELKKQMN